MTILARLRSLYRNLVHRSRADRELDDEVHAAFELLVDEKRRSGLAPDAAKRAATIEMGRVEAVTEQVRDVRAGALIASVIQDVRYALRLLRRSPAFTGIAIASLGLGIGANTAIFSLIDVVILKPLPVMKPDQLFFVDNTGGKSNGSNAPPYPCFEILRERNRFFAGLSAFNGTRVKVNIDGNEEELTGQVASGNYFSVLGVGAMYGRVLTPADDVPSGTSDGPTVGVISHALWTRRFGSNPAVLGKSVRVGNRPVTIVGVTPPGFFGLTPGARVDITIPIAVSGGLTERESWWFSVVGRLGENAGLEEARADLDAMFQRYMAETRMSAEGRRYFDRIVLVPAAHGLGEVRRQFSSALLVIMTIVGLVLLVGCANVANLLLARASARQTEISVRLAIGASRGRLVRQMLTESAVLAVIGAAAGLLFGVWGAGMLARFVSGLGNRAVFEPALDVRVLTFTAVVAALTGLLFGALPAFQATRSGRSIAATSGRATPSASRLRWGRALVAIQVALSLVLLTGAGLFVRTLRNLYTLDPGFERSAILVARVDGTLRPVPPGKPSTEMLRAEHARIWRTWETLIDSVAALPGVESVGASTLTPMSRRDRGVRIRIVGRPAVPEQDAGIHLNQVTPAYLQTIGIRLNAGRLFEPGDGPAAHRVAILNETAARFYFSGQNSLGSVISLGGTPGDDDYEIVGVVADARYANLRDTPERMIYVPIAQPRDRIGGVTLAIRGAIDVKSLVPAIRERARAIVPNGFVSSAATMTEFVEDTLIRERMVSLLASFFGGLALVMACIGLYGVTAYAVVRRTREIGIRIAIGAERGSVVWLVVKETAAMVAAGLVLGVPIVLGATRYIESQLFGVTPTDPMVLSAAMATLLAVSAAAAYLPARRASRVDPMVALRSE